jgi:hypothetical protein
MTMTTPNEFSSNGISDTNRLDPMDRFPIAFKAVCNLAGSLAKSVAGLLAALLIVTAVAYCQDPNAPFHRIQALLQQALHPKR